MLANTRYSLHVPLALNNGDAVTDLQLDAIESALLDIADGFTSTDSVGAWRNPDGQTYREAVRVYSVDIVDTRQNVAELIALADLVAVGLEQEAVYLTSAAIDARVISPVAL